MSIKKYKHINSVRKGDFPDYATDEASVLRCIREWQQQKTSAAIFREAKQAAAGLRTLLEMCDKHKVDPYTLKRRLFQTIEETNQEAAP